MQVDCTPPGGLAIRVQQLRLSDSGYLKLTPWDTAGVGSVSAIDYKSNSAPVCLLFQVLLSLLRRRSYYMNCCSMVHWIGRGAPL